MLFMPLNHIKPPTYPNISIHMYISDHALSNYAGCLFNQVPISILRVQSPLSIAAIVCLPEGLTIDHHYAHEHHHYLKNQVNHYQPS